MRLPPSGGSFLFDLNPGHPMETHEYDYGVDDYEYAQELCARQWDLATDWDALAYVIYCPEEY